MNLVSPEDMKLIQGTEVIVVEKPQRTREKVSIPQLIEDTTQENIEEVTRHPATDDKITNLPTMDMKVSDPDTEVMVTKMFHVKGGKDTKLSPLGTKRMTMACERMLKKINNTVLVIIASSFFINVQ